MHKAEAGAIPDILYRVPDILLSAIGLTGMNGIEGIRILKEKYPEMKFKSLLSEVLKCF